mmetsp:Transcript_21057/g.49959  ORF Transcript_21057/g.49959 Transcript_21057/m.49959 type:complete len:967 (-) Transcript_21057:58-2958(-)
MPLWRASGVVNWRVLQEGLYALAGARQWERLHHAIDILCWFVADAMGPGTMPTSLTLSDATSCTDLSLPPQQHSNATKTPGKGWIQPDFVRRRILRRVKCYIHEAKSWLKHHETEPCELPTVALEREHDLDDYASVRDWWAQSYKTLNTLANRQLMHQVASVNKRPEEKAKILHGLEHCFSPFPHDTDSSASSSVVSTPRSTLDSTEPSRPVTAASRPVTAATPKGKVFRVASLVWGASVAAQRNLRSDQELSEVMSQSDADDASTLAEDEEWVSQVPETEPPVDTTLVRYLDRGEAREVVSGCMETMLQGVRLQIAKRRCQLENFVAARRVGFETVAGIVKNVLDDIGVIEAVREEKKVESAAVAATTMDVVLSLMQTSIVEREQSRKQAVVQLQHDINREAREAAAALSARAVSEAQVIIWRGQPLVQHMRQIVMDLFESQRVSGKILMQERRKERERVEAAAKQAEEARRKRKMQIAHDDILARIRARAEMTALGNETDEQGQFMATRHDVKPSPKQKRRLRNMTFSFKDVSLNKFSQQDGDMSRIVGSLIDAPPSPRVGGGASNRDSRDVTPLSKGAPHVSTLQRKMSAKLLRQATMAEVPASSEQNKDKPTLKIPSPTKPQAMRRIGTFAAGHAKVSLADSPSSRVTGNTDGFGSVLESLEGSQTGLMSTFMRTGSGDIAAIDSLFNMQVRKAGLSHFVALPSASHGTLASPRSGRGSRRISLRGSSDLGGATSQTARVARPRLHSSGLGPRLPRAADLFELKEESSEAGSEMGEEREVEVETWTECKVVCPEVLVQDAREAMTISMQARGHEVTHVRVTTHLGTATVVGHLRNLLVSVQDQLRWQWGLSAPREWGAPPWDEPPTPPTPSPEPPSESSSDVSDLEGDLLCGRSRSNSPPVGRGIALEVLDDPTRRSRLADILSEVHGDLYHRIQPQGSGFQAAAAKRLEAAHPSSADDARL